ncbi:MAG: hypothetical protein DHS20C15_01070 [Planctomycetota bacterium]|nr:MAG: hypothetical protein DHS20C15_01070 [Planctomycetota bacterium]
MSRRLGLLLPLLMLGLLVLLREVQSDGAARIARGEERALHVLDRFVSATDDIPAADVEALRAQLTGIEGLHAFTPENAQAGTAAYAQDRSYMYGLAQLAERDAQSGTLRQLWVLRAWPLDFGVTGDAEFQLGTDGVLWEGQNLRGRSGTDTGFPPPFPEPDVTTRPGGWWTRPRPAHR